MTYHVRDFMSTNLETLEPTSTLQDAVQLEMRRRIRHIPIVEGGRLVGIVTDRDLKRAMPSLLTGTERETYERVMHETSVAQIMTKSPVTTTPDTPLKEAVRVLADKRIGALPVVTDHELVGILTETDLLRALFHFLERA